MKLGFIVNPIAGMGGKVGLKGTDNVLREALNRGAQPVAPVRAAEFLNRLKKNAGEVNVEILACPGIMGEEEAKAVGFQVGTLSLKLGEKTSAADTKLAVQLLIQAHVDLIVFVGGDGTAVDILDALNGNELLPVLGVPSGVKMYSGIFAISPADAADVVLAFAGKETETAEFEIIDADEEAIRNDSFALRLHGYMEGLWVPTNIQGSKQVSPDTTDERDNQMAIARFVVEERKPGATWILGPGTTVNRIAELLGIGKTVLGVDIYRNGIVIRDVNEERILNEIKDWSSTWIVVSPIGHQGIIFGRGNQQISPEIIKLVGRERIIVVATKSKLQQIEGKILRVDTDDSDVNTMMKGYIRVVTDYREWRIMPVS